VGFGVLGGFDASRAPDRVWGSLGLQGFKLGISAFVPPPTPPWTRLPTRRTERSDVSACFCALPRRSSALLRSPWKQALPPWGKHPGMSSLVAFATALHDLHCVPLSRRTSGLRGPSSGAGFATQAVNSSSLLTFGADFPDAGPTPAARRFRAELPLLGLSKIVPPSYALVESTPELTLAGSFLGPPSADVDRVPPSWFLTTSTGCSSSERAGMLHPTTDHGIRHVSDPCEGPFP